MSLDCLQGNEGKRSISLTRGTAKHIISSISDADQMDIRYQSFYFRYVDDIVRLWILPDFENSRRR
jgi:hypothetical protein